MVELDVDMFAAVEIAAAQEWGTLEELVALVARIGHEHFRAFLKSNGVRESQLPKQLDLVRPGALPRRPARPRNASPDEMRQFFRRS